MIQREGTVSDLIAIAYPDRAAVELAKKRVHQAGADGLLQIEDVVVLIRDEDGKIEVRQGGTGVGAAAAGGAIWGGLIGLLLLAPLFGIAVGAVAGGAKWKSEFGDAGAAHNFVNELSANLTPGSAALILLVRDMTLERVLPQIQQHGHVIRTTLSEGAKAQLDAALAAAKPDRPSGAG
ncbi:DUF1269 domain-containing protein [Nonomuraea lactucae]|uniref:DUF1269 domain-containing protein n=1 Tax=Nonomuraea lactucae TaxID=2249762 RepID=UPI000DE46390|nr:DUF1269 domain-containing protein [Nonomuraea lactucae]